MGYGNALQSVFVCQDGLETCCQKGDRQNTLLNFLKYNEVIST